MLSSTTPYGPRVRRALAWQRRHASAFDPAGFPPLAHIRYVGGADLAFAPPDARTTQPRSGAVGCPAIGIALVWDLLEQRVVEQAYARVRVNFPYVPGLLSFREAPVLAAAIKRLHTPASVWLFDGHGQAHPRGLGLATHVGVQHHLVSIGVAKSLLIGRVDQSAVATRPDSCCQAPVIWHDRTIALALWRPPSDAELTLPPDLIYVSPGHHCTLHQAADLVARCLRPGMILPEPTRRADALSKQVRTLSAGLGRQLIESPARSLRP